MLEKRGNIWKYQSEESIIVIPTNGTVKVNGECVMGRGLALQTKIRFPAIPLLIGDHIKKEGNIVDYFPLYGLVSFPVKWDWNQNADKLLIYRSLKELVNLTKSIDKELENDKESVLKKGFKVYLPRVGCGNGGLDWKEVKPLVEEVLVDNRYIVVDRMYQI